MCICVSVYVSNTTKLRKDYIFKMSFFYDEKQTVSLRLKKSLIVIVYECLRGPSMLLFFSPVDSHWRECVAAVKKLGKKRERVFEDDVFIENTRLVGGSKRRTKFTHGRSSKQVTWFSWPMVSRDWICERPPSLWNKWHTAQNNL